jgi:hypothetical protein
MERRWHYSTVTNVATVTVTMVSGRRVKVKQSGTRGRKFNFSYYRSEIEVEKMLVEK